MNRCTLLALLLPWALLQGPVGKAQAQPPLPKPVMKVRDGYQGGWDEVSKAKQEAAAQKEELFTAPSEYNSAAEALDVFRQERNRALIANHGRLTPMDRSRLRQWSKALQAAHPGSFEAELAAYYADFPSRSASARLEAAALLQPERLELIGPRLAEALRHGDPAALKAASRDMKRRGALAPGLLSLADDLLLSVSPGAALITAGEMDGFPLLVRQHAEGKRQDLLLIDLRLLEDPAYRARSWSAASADGPVPATTAAFIEQLPGATSRPVFLSLALGREWAERFAQRLHVTGLAMRLGDAPTPVSELARAWAQMRKTTEAGPLSRNYLVPAAILLKHYRTEGLEEPAAELEHEIRKLAGRLGMTAELQANGILPH